MPSAESDAVFWIRFKLILDWLRIGVIILIQIVPQGFLSNEKIFIALDIGFQVVWRCEAQALRI